MKPRELYSGPAPAAMGMMGQGLSEVGANIGRSIQSGYQALGQGLAAGLERGAGALASAYLQYSSAKTSNDITKKMLEDPQYAAILGLPDPSSSPEEYNKVKTGMLKNLNDTIKAHGEVGGSQFSKQLLGPIQEYAAIGRQYAQQQKIADTQAQTARLVGLSGAMMPYVIGPKGQPINADTFIAPEFKGGTEPVAAPVVDQSPVQQQIEPPAQRPPKPTLAEVNAFMAENPSGGAAEFSLWRKQRASQKSPGAKFDPTVILPY